jgi:REP element-mobilizing transposase RayT
MILNEYGIIAENEWFKTSEIRNNVELYEFVVMPNHIHGIIRISRRRLSKKAIFPKSYPRYKKSVGDFCSLSQ